MLRRFQVDPFDLLGQKEIYPYPVKLPGTGEPTLSIGWNSFHQNFFSELAAFFRWTRVPKGDAGFDVFRDCRIQRSIPVRAVFAAALWHIVFFVVPWPTLPGAAKHNPALDNTELTWSGSIDDLPLLNIPKRAPKTAQAKPQETPAEAEGTDAYHPRQRILTDPSHPTHPRQTLVQPAAPMEAPKFLPALPNMVQLATTAGPARPRLEISAQTLAKLRPKEVKHAATTDVPAPDAPNLETRPADMSLASIATGVERPKLEMNAGSAPRLAEHAQKGDVVPTPDLATATGETAGGPAETIIALSASPAPPAPVVEVPKGNLAAHVAISPEGKGAGAGGGSGRAANGTSNGSGAVVSSEAAKSSIGISISGGNPKPNAGMSGLGGGGKLILPKAQTVYKRPDPNADADDPPERTGPPDFAGLAPGAQPEQIFGTHRVYSLNVNMPNLNSATGSWVIHFSELHLSRGAYSNDEMSTPVPVRKIDPKYPPDLVQEHVQGEVILYAVIQPDGSVNSIQVVHKLDPQLDANSVAAFRQWKFEPAMKDGAPIAMEAIVHIPFREPPRE